MTGPTRVEILAQGGQRHAADRHVQRDRLEEGGLQVADLPLLRDVDTTADAAAPTPVSPSPSAICRED
jgi:methylmalonyl-CoA mutase cobalamin-binding subunit